MSAPLNFYKQIGIARYSFLRHCLAAPNILTRKTTRFYCSDENKPTKSKLDLAKPGKAYKKKKKAEETESGNESTELGLEPALIDAAKDVGKSVTDSQSDRVVSDLLDKLFEHKELTNVQKDGSNVKSKTESLSTLLTGMKANKKQKPITFINTLGGDRDQSRPRGEKFDFRRREESHPTGERVDQMRQQRTRRQIKFSDNYPKLFEGDGLGIFSKHVSDDSKKIAAEYQETGFDILEREEREHLMSVAPSNAFLEEIELTKKGKMWKFPIDNEEGMEEEKEVGFHEHVFFDHLLVDFPDSRPVRHFMELVTVGLSNNPYITAQQKREHVLWFKEYFETNYDLLQIEDSIEQTAAVET